MVIVARWGVSLIVMQGGCQPLGGTHWGWLDWIYPHLARSGGRIRVRSTGRYAHTNRRRRVDFFQVDE